MVRTPPSSSTLQRDRVRSPPQRRLAKLFFAVACGALAICVLPALVQPPVHRTPDREQAALLGNQLVEAARRYQKTFGRWPRGTHAEMIAALRGENPKGTIFFQAPEKTFSAAGELLDPWRKPYRFVIDERGNRPVVHSAGPDGQFANVGERSDDFLSTQSGAGPSGIPGLPF